MKLEIEVSQETFTLLFILTATPAMGGHSTIEAVIAHLLASAAAGIRRPGSWERGWIVQAFGELPPYPYPPAL